MQIGVMIASVGAILLVISLFTPWYTLSITGEGTASSASLSPIFSGGVPAELSTLLRTAFLVPAVVLALAVIFTFIRALTGEPAGILAAGAASLLITVIFALVFNAFGIPVAGTGEFMGYLMEGGVDAGFYLAILGSVLLVTGGAIWRE